MVLAVGSPFYKTDSLSVLEDYFKTHSIPYVIIHNQPLSVDTRGSHPSWWKLICHRILPEYDFILNWDLDLLPISRDTRVVQDIIMTELCMAKDSFVLYRPAHEKFLPSFQYNGGLIGIPKAYADFTESVFDTFAPGTYPSYEQYYLNEEIVRRGISVFELPNDLNRTLLAPDFLSARLKHYTSTDDAKSMISSHVCSYFSNVRIYETRLDMIADLVPPNGRYCEVGVFAGDLSTELIRILRPQKLYLIDFFEGTMGSGDQDGNNFKFINLSDVYANLTQRYSTSDVIEVMKGDSVTCMQKLESDSLDMVYIDADHSYDGTKRDLEIAFKKVRHGGWILGHDYEMYMKKAHREYHFGVRRAVDEFCKNYKQSIYAKGLDGCVSFAIKLMKPSSGES